MQPMCWSSPSPDHLLPLNSWACGTVNNEAGVKSYQKFRDRSCWLECINWAPFSTDRGVRGHVQRPAESQWLARAQRPISHLDDHSVLPIRENTFLDCWVQVIPPPAYATRHTARSEACLLGYRCLVLRA
jgi:hypothetical protein